ncbi:hypothetical protein F2P56_012412 [Juglans regia]|uniref:Fungal lipase-type domain-containing protein n=1 Tax=Juglans regia TaxID=51240 RepID=A0A834CYS6_JUGRE|nr:hypothetical protein F2P56_012412 [Juglans regia]
MAPYHDNTKFCDCFFMLKPEEASLWELVRFMLFSESETKRFIECTEEHKRDFWRRWYIFNSLLLQKLLSWGKVPMVQIGNMMELWLNLLSGNGGFLMLFSNFIKDFLGQASTQAIMLQDTSSKPNLIVVAFTGTRPFDPVAWGTDVDLSWFEIPNVGKVHSGFMKALGLQKDTGWPKEINQLGSHDQRQFAYYAIRQRLREILQKNEGAKFILTGHSLGGALAILFVTVLAMHEEAWLLEKLEGVYTFGQPRVGNKQFGDYMKEKLKKYDVSYFRFVYCNDLVPRVPYDDEFIFFEHCAPCIYFNSFYESKVLLEEPNKNYFGLFWEIPKYVNAVFELIRGFIIPYMKGEEYKESLLMQMCRVMGLIIPGLSAHLPPDYVNATRLGSLPTELQNPTHDDQHKLDSKAE